MDPDAWQMRGKNRDRRGGERGVHGRLGCLTVGMPREQESRLQLGVRGVIRAGAAPGTQVLVDSVDLTPVDPLVVIVSPNLDEQGHADEQVLRIWPADIDELLVAWDVEWTGIADDQAGDRFV